MLGNFLRAVAAGSMVPYAMAAITSFVDDGDFTVAIVWGPWIIGVSFAVVFAASLLVGFPLSMILAEKGRESRNAYLGSGAFLGGVIALVGLFIGGGFQLVLLLAIMSVPSGAVTALVWWYGRSVTDVS